MSSSAVTAPTATKLRASKLFLDESAASTPLGRRLIVKERIPAGSLLLRLDPLISVLDNALLDKACSTCFISSKEVDAVAGKELLKCTGCRMLRYCSKVLFF